MKLIALDPGLTTGWAEFDLDNETPLAIGEVGWKEPFCFWLRNQKPDLFVVENYRIRPASNSGWTHQWLQVTPARVIGAVEFYADELKVPVVFQEPSIKTIASKRSGLKVPKTKKGSHQLDAILHGWYYIHYRKG